jgi:hypothetical protein
MSKAMFVGITVYCGTCGKRKAPHGRSIPDIPESGYCSRQSDCPGYDQEPLPGCLWPGETDEEFGYPCCDRATKPAEDHRTAIRKQLRSG